jgi:hypothetical protein
MPKEIRFCQPIGEYYFLSPLSAHPIKMVVDEKFEQVKSNSKGISR